MKINANRRRPALGSDPFDALVPETPPSSSRQKRKAEGPEDSIHVSFADGAARAGARTRSTGHQALLSPACAKPVCDQKSSTWSGSGAKPSQSGAADLKAGRPVNPSQ